MSKIGLSLQGQFKFELYDKDKNLLKNFDFINNFITNTGVLYPYHFAFADCFRFLSAGSGDKKNSIRIQDETTGLHIPIKEFSYIGSRNKFEDLDNENTNYSNSPSCGYRFPKENVIELYRQWTLPNNIGGNLGAFQESGSFREFIVSPGRPHVVAENGKKFCTCNQSSGIYSGLDCSAIAEYYEWVYEKSKNLPSANRKLKICDGDKAFARIVLDNPINYFSGDVLNVTYKLSVTIDSGINFRSLRPQDPINSNWDGKLNFISNITQPGIKLINDGEIKYKSYNVKGPKQLRLQHYDYDDITNARKYDFRYEYGESFIPPHGIPLEPSNLFLQNINLKNIICYLTEDNTQFLISSSGGPIQLEKTGELAPWNFYSKDRTYYSGDYAYSGNQTYKYINSNPDFGKLLNNNSYWSGLGFLKIVEISNSGLKPFKNDFNKVIEDPSNYWLIDNNQYDIRKNGTYPSTGDVLIKDSLSTRFSFQGIDSKNPVFSKNARTGTVQYTFAFPDFIATPEGDLQAKNLVIAYKDISYNDIVSDSTSFIPFFDVLFSGTGKIFIPKILTGIQSYQGFGIPFENTGASISGSDNQDYFYLGSQSNAPYPIFNTLLNWTVPCPPSASGCS